MTNREKLLDEIGKLSNEQLTALMEVGYEGLMTNTRDFGLIVCRTCKRCEETPVGFDDEWTCPTALGGWMDMECTTDRIMEV